MDYNTETLATIAKSVTEVFKTTLAHRLQTGDTGEPALTIADVEQEFRELLRQIGARALSQFLSSALGTPTAEMACDCGGTLHYQRRRSATLTTVFGKITYERAYYAGGGCGHGKAPLDEQYGLEPGAMSSGLAALLGLAGIEFGFDESRAWLQAFLWFDVSENSVRSETQTLGALQAEREEVVGTVESGCKQIVTRRLKRSGAQWTVDGAVRTARARAAWLSGEWETLCAQRARLPLAV